MTLKQIALQAFNDMPDDFFSSMLVGQAKKIDMNRRYSFADTFMRKVRQLRQDGVINYRVTDYKEGLYQKLNVTIL